MNLEFKGSITALISSSKKLAKELSSKGFEVELEIFKSGKGGTQHFGPSNVNLIIEKDDTYEDITITAGGFGKAEAWSVIKKKINSLLDT